MNADQLGNITTLAQVYAAYYNSLCEHGMPPEMAIVLTRDYQRMQFNLIFNKPSAPAAMEGERADAEATNGQS